MVLYPEGAPPPGLILSPLFWRSGPFVNAVRDDVTKVLNQFVHAWENKRQGEETIFQCFQRIWTSTGWCHIHLVVVEPSLRPDWWDTVTHCFSEHINVTKPADTHQIGALCALYTLEFTQPTIQFISALPIKLTIPTIKHILTFSEALQDKPSALDIQWIISQLLSSEHAYTYIVPDNCQQYPPLPTNRAINRSLSLDAHDEISTLASSIKQEVDTSLEDGLLAPSAKEAYKQAKSFLTSNSMAKALLLEASRKAKEDLANQQPVGEVSGLASEGNAVMERYLKHVQEAEVDQVRGAKGLFGLVGQDADREKEVEEQVARFLASGSTGQAGQNIGTS